MRLASHASPIDSNAPGRDRLQAGGHSNGKQTRHRIDPDLVVAENIWTDEVVLGLLERWLVPAIVDSLIRELLNSRVDEVR